MATIDAAGGFLELLREKAPQDPKETLELWEGFHRGRFPELYRKQVEDYAGDWREIALSRVFPGLVARIPAMEDARRGLREIWPRVLRRAAEALDFREEVVGVVHVGIGCGAGWATDYGGRPAVLFGLEMIAELGWHPPERLEGLCAHELGHIVHRTWRGEPLEPLEAKPAGLLYAEGFAQRLEGLILGRESFHQADAGWHERCEALLPEIAREYLLRLDGGDVRPFFGSWFDFRGLKFTGYLLGRRFIEFLEGTKSLREIAALPPETVEEPARDFLERLSAKGR